MASGVAALALYKLLRSESECEEGGSFPPDDVARLSAAYEHTLELLELKDRTDPITAIIAKKIIDVFKSGEHDAGRLCSRAIQELGIQIRPRS